MPNHFHFLIRIKPEKELHEYFNAKVPGKKSRGPSATLRVFKTLGGLAKQDALSQLLSQQFAHLFNGYVQAFNKQYKRKGSLLMHRYNRKRIDTENYLRQVVLYIHKNPVEAGLASTLKGWDYSSYEKIVNENDPFLNAKEILEWFGDRENFVYVHESLSDPNNDIYNFKPDED